MGGGLVALTLETGRLRFKRPEVALPANNRTWNEIQIFNISQFVKSVPKLHTVREENENDRKTLHNNQEKFPQNLPRIPCEERCVLSPLTFTRRHYCDPRLTAENTELTRLKLMPGPTVFYYSLGTESYQIYRT